MNVPVLLIQFDVELKPHEVRAYRKAISSHPDLAPMFDRFYEEETRKNGFPLVQFKLIGRKLALFCMGECAEEVHEAFKQPRWKVEFREGWVWAEVISNELRQFILHIDHQFTTYQISDWLALDPETYQEYSSMLSWDRKKNLLESKLVGNTITMVNTLGWSIERPIRFEIISEPKIEPIDFNDFILMSFSLVFRSNVFLPNFIGFGRKVNIGYGVIREKRQRKPIEKKNPQSSIDDSDDAHI